MVLAQMASHQTLDEEFQRERVVLVRLCNPRHKSDLPYAHVAIVAMRLKFLRQLEELTRHIVLVQKKNHAPVARCPLGTVTQGLPNPFFIAENSVLFGDLLGLFPRLNLVAVLRRIAGKPRLHVLLNSLFLRNYLQCHLVAV